MRTFEIVRDTPEAKAGTLIYQTPCGNYTDREKIVFYYVRIVENNPEWFKEVFEAKYPKTWEQAIKANEKKIAFFISSNSSICEGRQGTMSLSNNNHNLIATEKQAKSVLAFCQLSIIHAQMINVYEAETGIKWIADWSNTKQYKYCVICDTELDLMSYTTRFHPFPFPTQELGEFSREHHSELWLRYYQQLF